MKRILIYLLMAVLLGSCVSPAYAESSISHIKGMNAIGFRAGTGLGQTFDVGILYQYHFSKRWSFLANVDFEKGKFQNADFWGIKVYPGVECSVWHPASWFYLHLIGDINMGYDNWENKDIDKKTSGFVLGLDLGVNFEFYAIPQLSFVLQAQQGWDWGFYNTGGYNYFHPLFSLGIKYNFK
ncbi:MAG: conjugal transfer protein TraO [Paludibacteraceae bacterium]|nr:conjugal transfer protein TraO [Paludibacteraceae bacterium]